MDNKENYLEFISSENYKHQLEIWYKAYNISHEKTILFHDFLISLFDLIESTYMGSEIMTSDSDQFYHFTWCWDQTLLSFSKESIIFKEQKKELFDYFWSFFYEAFYISKLTGGSIKIKEYFFKLFDFKHKKSRSELDMLTEIYKLFDQNLKK